MSRAAFAAQMEPAGLISHAGTQHAAPPRARDATSRCSGYDSLSLFRLRPVAFVGAPQVDVAEAEGIPPGVQHGAIEAQDAIASYACRRRSERGEAVIDAGAIGITDAGKQMPESERIFLARVGKEDAEQGVALRRSGGAKIKFGQSGAGRSGGVFEIGRGPDNLWASLADGARGDEGFVVVQLEAHPAHGRAQKAGA